ncbi:MAG: Fic family protein [Rhizomicrobium sp.]
MSADDPYLYPGTSVLRNKLAIMDAVELDRIERRLVAQRVTEEIPRGNFDLDHLKTIHRHLFQDIFAWAGEIRTVELAKGRQQFQFRRYIDTGMADIHRRLEQADFLRDVSRVDFAEQAGRIMGDLNYVHPFREGNGRTQLLYLEQLADRAGHPMDLRRIDPARWIAASRGAHEGDCRLIAAEIARALEERSR